MLSADSARAELEILPAGLGLGFFEPNHEFGHLSWPCGQSITRGEGTEWALWGLRVIEGVPNVCLWIIPPVGDTLKWLNWAIPKRERGTHRDYHGILVSWKLTSDSRTRHLLYLVDFIAFFFRATFLCGKLADVSRSLLHYILWQPLGVLMEVLYNVCLGNPVGQNRNQQGVRSTTKKASRFTLYVQCVRATPKPASSMAHSTVTRALALWAHT